MERMGVDILGPFPVTDSVKCYFLVAMVKIQHSRTLFVTYTYRICSEMKSDNAQRNVQKNNNDNFNWKGHNQNNDNIYNIYSEIILKNKEIYKRKNI